MFRDIANYICEIVYIIITFSSEARVFFSRQLEVFLSFVNLSVNGSRIFRAYIYAQRRGEGKPRETLASFLMAARCNKNEK